MKINEDPLTIPCKYRKYIYIYIVYIIIIMILLIIQAYIDTNIVYNILRARAGRGGEEEGEEIEAQLALLRINRT